MDGRSEKVGGGAVLPVQKSDWVPTGVIALALILTTLTGILIIFVWRLLAKFVLHLALPPLFRALAHCFELPRRRFYTPATDYAHVPAENGLYPIPSVIDLPDTLEVSGVCGEHTKSEIKRRTHAGIAKARLSKGTSTDTDHFFNQEGELEGTKSTVGTEVKHYDADGALRLRNVCHEH